MRLISSITLSLLAAGALQAADKFTLDADGGHCAALFKVTHLGASYTYGRFDKLSGSFTVDAANPAANSIKVEIDVASVSSANAKRDEHLRSADFFNAKQFPTMSFASTSWKKVDEKTFEVAGDISLKGVTKPLTVTVKKVGEGADPWGGFRMGFETTFVIKRSDFGITFMPGGIGEDVTITFGVEGIKQK